MDKENQIDDPVLRSIKSMFEHGEVKRMYEIHKLSPTKITKALGLNHGRYIDKLSNPEKFSVKDIMSLSTLLRINPEIVFRIIIGELNKR
jgi:hypothetical protein